MGTTAYRDTGEALDAIDTALASIDHDRRRELSPEDQLALVRRARPLADRVLALVGTLVAEADHASASEAVTGTPLTSWLMQDGRTTRQEASALVFTGRDLDTHDDVREAALAGTVTVPQARGIVRALGELPSDLPPDEREQAGSMLLQLAQTTGADRLRRLGPSVLAAVAPDHPANPTEAEGRAASERQLALKRRTLTWRSDGEGSTVFHASLPDIEASAFIKLVEAHQESTRQHRRSAADRRDPRSVLVDVGQRRADALMSLVLAHQSGREAPSLAGDRPRIVVTMSEVDLARRVEQAGLLDSGAPVPAGDLRRLCCDADLMPAVLGSKSELLDVGTVVRLVTPALRRALALRDSGCVFPGCEVSGSLCDAHHVVPWWRGGATALSNLLLLCPHHHALVEPPRFWDPGPDDERWVVRLDADGYPEVVPPVSIDPERTPLRHSRPRPAA